MDIQALDYNSSYGDICIGILSDDGKRPDKPNDEYDGGYVDECHSWSYHNDGYSYSYVSSRDYGPSMVPVEEAINH